MSTKVNVTTTATKPTVTVAQTGDVTVEAIQSGDVVVDVAYNPVGTTSGDVYGPASSTDNAIARFDGVTGKVIQNSGITIADGASGTLSGTNTGDQNLFGTIAVSGQSNIVADSTNDTLTFVAGSNITITTDPSTDAITIAASGSGSGTVTSVAISGTDGIQVDSGSPITTSGTIQLGVDAATMKTTLDLAGTNTGDQNVFSTFAVSGQSNVVADSTADTLTLVAGSNITITTDASTDSITINSTASGSGDVVGPASSTDNDVALFDGITGKLIKDGGTFSSLIASSTNAATSKTTPIDADELPLVDSAASFSLKKLTWANLKATAKTYFDTLYQPLATILTTLSGLANSQGVLTNNGSGTLSYTPTSAGGNGPADSTKIPLFNAEGGINCGDYSNYSGNTMAFWKIGLGNVFAGGVDIFGQVFYAEVNGTGSDCYHAHVTASATGSNTAFDADLTGGTGVNTALACTANPSHYLVHLIEKVSGTEYDRFTIDAQGDHTWYKNGTTISSGTDKTILTYDTPSGTNTITLPAATGTVALTSALSSYLPLAGGTLSGTLSLPTLAASGSGGLTIDASNGTDIGILGAGNTANVEWYGSHNFNAATQDTIAAFTGAGKTLGSLATSTYPSLTELSYVKGVTSAIQTQIDGKQASDAQLTSLATLSYTGNAGKVVAVNGAENNFELISVGGTGTVTSVAISGTDGIEVDSGSPITTSGTIQLGVNAATMKTTLDLTGTNSGDVTLSGTPDYITISGQTITRGLIDLTTDVTGDLPLTNFAQASAASKLLGRGSASGAGDFEEITLGSGLSMSGTTLSASGGSSNVDVRLYTADDTWTNPSPSTAKRVFVKLVGGGAGGGSGRKGAAGTNRYGGSGGAPGATVETWFLTTDLASTISVTIGAGGTGGTSVTTNSTSGNNGNAGGTTTFSTVSAVGGLAGVRGTDTSANQPGGKSNSCLFGLTSAASLGAGSGSNSTGSSVAASITSFPTGGGGGGGLNTSNTTASGGTGGGVGEGTYMQLVAGGTAGTAGNTGGNGNSARGVGTGGGGGGSSASGNAGAGGNGGGYGSGGGGGGASTDDVGNSGAGGNGAGGYALIITYT